MWLHVPIISCPSAPASAALSLESASRDQALAGSATWRGKSLPPRGWSRVCKTGPFIRLLSGLTSPPSTASLGVDSWIASLRATRASQTASPERVSARTTIVGSSTMSSASSMKFGLIVSSERTSLGTRTGSSPPSSRHWKAWATALRLEYSQRAAPEPTTSGSASSSWPTATANMITGSSGRDGGDNLQTASAVWPTPTSMDSVRSPGQGFTTPNITLNHAVARDWPTPMAGSPAQNGNNAAGNNDFSRRVMEITQQWSTPRASDGEKGGPNQAFGAGGQPLPSQAAQWETPSVAVTAGSRLSRGGERSSELLLTGQAVEVSRWPTPAARDYKGSGPAVTRADGKSRMDMLDWKAERGFSLPPVPATPSGLRSSEPRRILLRLYLTLTKPKASSFGRLRAWVGRVMRPKLNPSFVDWMHGWPSEWTDLEREVTGFRPWLLRSRGELSRLLSSTTSQLDLFS